MTTCPKGVQKVGTSTVDRPVTQVAETAANSAGMSSGAEGSVRAKGSMSARVPSPMTARKPRGMSRSGWAWGTVTDPYGHGQGGGRPLVSTLPPPRVAQGPDPR